MTRPLAVLAILLLVAACPTETEDLPPPPLADAGTESFVRNVLPVLWGRNPLSAREVAVFVQLAQQTDRATLVRAMTTSSEYVDRWTEVLYDSLFVNRAGERANGACYSRRRLQTDDSDLAEWVRDHDPQDGAFAEPWTMADLVRSSLWLDDISPIHRVHLFAQMAKDIPLQGIDAAKIVRRNLWELFEQTYLNRQLGCMGCHNSAFAVTDRADPTMDRHWPLPGRHEQALFGDDAGRPAEDLYTFFRKHDVLGGYNIFGQQYDIRPTGCWGGDAPGCDGCACEEYVCDQRPSCCTDWWSQECVNLCNESGAGCVPGLPEDFSGCTALYGYPGCGGCECEQDVCAAYPFCCEEGWTEFCSERCRLWYPQNCEYPGGYYDYWDFGPDAIEPWGMHEKCGKFNPPGVFEDDPLGLDAYFIDAYGPEATIWDLERPLHQGFDSLRDGLDLDSDRPSGPEAFAFLVSARLAEVVWNDVFDNRLTVPNHFPRNEPQQKQLQSLTRAFYESGYSLSELIVQVVTHPDFNAVAPADVVGDGATPYALEPIYDPWVTDFDDLESRRNSLGDILHRKHPRMLVNGANTALGWPDWPAFPAEPDAGPEGRLQEYLGFFLKDSIQGFRGNDFQGLAAWEFAFGACQAEQERTDGCGPRAGAGCDGCGCEFSVCMTDPDCCDVRWDARCVGLCGESTQGCTSGPEVPVAPPPWLTVLLEEMDRANAEGPRLSLEDAVLALKDRILADPTLVDAAERDLLAALLGQPLDTPWDDVATPEAKLKWACSAFLASPQYQLAGIPIPDVLPADSAVVVPGSSWLEFCENAASLFDPGAVTCGAGTLTVTP